MARGAALQDRAGLAADGAQLPVGARPPAAEELLAATTVAADASARPSARPPSTSDGQCARSITRATPTASIIATASTRTVACTRGRRLSARYSHAPKYAAAAVACPLGNPYAGPSGRGRPTAIFSRPSASGAATMSAIHTHHVRRARSKTANRMSVPGNRNLQSPATFTIRITPTTAG